jgi:hypothetical protein
VGRYSFRCRELSSPISMPVYPGAPTAPPYGRHCGRPDATRLRRTGLPVSRPSSRQTCGNGTTACHGRARRHDELRTLASCANKSSLSVQRADSNVPLRTTNSGRADRLRRLRRLAVPARGFYAPVVGHDAAFIKHAVRDASQVLLGIRIAHSLNGGGDRRGARLRLDGPARASLLSCPGHREIFGVGYLLRSPFQRKTIGWGC